MSHDVLRPHYADGFRCIGPGCEQSCCQGWGVFVDKATYKKYRTSPSLRRLTAEHMQRTADAGDNFRFARVKLGPDNQCPFLTEDKLCCIQKQYGAAFLSKTCARYPRALVRFEGEMQKGLYLSCPEAARLVLLSPQLLPSGNGSRYQDFLSGSPDPVGASGWVRPLRAFTLELLQDRSYPLWQRLFLLGIVYRRAQEFMASQQASQLRKLLAQYATMALEGTLRPHLDGIPARPALQLNLLLQLIHLRFRLEKPHPAFDRCVADFLQAIGYSPESPLADEAARYQNGYQREHERFTQAFPSLMENYLLNYVFRTGFPLADKAVQQLGASDLLTNYSLLALHYSFLRALLIGAAVRQGSALSPAHVVRVVHAFARGVEHNEVFLNQLMTFAGSPELRQSDGLAVLLRN